MPIYGRIELVNIMSNVRKNQKESDELKTKISYNIKKYRKMRKYTQEELAEYADISYDFMRRIESTKGKCGFSVFTIYKLALALNVSIDELMELDIKESIGE